MARILILSYEFAPFRGGIAAVVEGLAAGAADAGHEVHVLAPDYHADQSPEDDAFPFDVHRFAGDFCSILSIDKLTRYALLVRRTIRRLRPDAVHAADPQSHMALTALSRLGMARAYGVTVHGTELLRYRDETMPRLWMHGAFAKPAFVTPVSEAVRTLLLARPDVDPDRVAVAYPGIAPQWIDRPAADRSAIRGALGFGVEDLILVTVARRVPAKGHQRVIEALSTLDGPLRRRVAYVVVGAGPTEYARVLVRAAGAGSVRLHLAGGLDDPATMDLLDAADLFVMLSQATPTRLEGLGLAYIEAGARGVPALAAVTGGVAEAVLPGVTGCVLAGEPDTVTIADALAGLFMDVDRRDRLGKAAQDHARSFTWRRHADQTFGRLLETAGLAGE